MLLNDYSKKAKRQENRSPITWVTGGGNKFKYIILIVLGGRRRDWDPKSIELFRNSDPKTLKFGILLSILSLLKTKYKKSA